MTGGRWRSPATNGGSPLWRFSLATYASPAVAEACLHLQDTHGADVNLLLFGMWRAVDWGDLVTTGEFAELDAAVRGWRDQAVVPMRSVRRYLKTMLPVHGGRIASIRTEVKRVELLIEKVEQDIIYDIASRRTAERSPADTAEAAARENAHSYGRFIEIEADDSLDALVAAVLDAR